jgi:ABC-type polysaccharide/polyol phosphate export permease
MDKLYAVNPFTIFMLWVRDIASANGFDYHVNALKVFLFTLAMFALSYLLFRSMEAKVGDNL